VVGDARDQRAEWEANEEKKKIVYLLREVSELEIKLGVRRTGDVDVVAQQN
jgi:hypothetical protein